MRIQGRCLRPSNLAERRVLKSLGLDSLRVPRRLNPFAVARQLRKVALGTGGDLPALRALLTKERERPVVDLPDSIPVPRGDERAA
jgi:hypothetical protein